MGRRKRFDGDELKRLRQCTPWTQKELALKLGVSRETVCAIENNKPETMEKIAAPVIAKWKSLCFPYTSEAQKKSFEQYLKSYFNFF